MTRLCWFPLCVVVAGALLASCGDADSTARARSARPVIERDFAVSEHYSVFEASAAGVSRSSGDALRHLYSHASVVIEDDVSRTTVTEVFSNEGTSATPLVCRFPLPEGASLVSVVEVVDGVRREASAAERDSARKELARAEQAGERGSLAEQDGGMFTMKFSSVAPRDSRRVEISYVQSVSALGAERSYVFPHRHLAASAPRLFELDARVISPRRLRELSVVNQEDARVSRASEHALAVRLSRLGSVLERDLELRWTEQSEALELSGRAARAAEAPGYFTARFAFNADESGAARPARDVVLVLDSSLSMAGEPLEAAKRAALSAVEGLGARDRVALVSFDERIRSDAALEPCTPARAALLRAAIGQLRPAGGSNVDGAVDRAAELLRGSANGVLLMLTDGQPTVGDDLDHLTPAASAADFAKVTTVVGLFNYPARQAELSALFPAATVRYVADGKASERATRELAGLALSAAIENVQLSVQGAAEGSLVQSVPPRLLLGDALRVSGRLTAPVSITVRGKLHGRAIEKTLRLVPEADAQAHETLSLEWARARVAELEARHRAEPSEALREEIVKLGTEHSLATMFTSFVATDSLGPDRVMPGDPEIRVHASPAAQAVFARLPWGETVELSYDRTERVWLGRFLVPRSMPDALYRVRVYVSEQGQTQLRSTLLVRVDSKPPQFVLALEQRAGTQRLVARPKEDVFDLDGDAIRPDLVDVRSLVARAGGRSFVLEADGEVWSAASELAPGTHEVELIATDFASNVARSRLHVEVRP